MLPTENVQDYPRPPLLERAPYLITARLGGEEILRTEAAWRVCETHHPPSYYIPREALSCEVLPAKGSSFCEWKGRATYWSLKVGGVIAPRCAWSYPTPTPGFAPLKDHLAIYPEALEVVFVDGMEVTPQPGGFYGGWVTANLTGQIKGAPGTEWW